jgi:hypothetical protein
MLSCQSDIVALWSWQVAQLDQGTRDTVATRLLQLTLRELYDWRFMQTDPNWGNFLYDQQTGRLNLIDFGAAKEYPRRWAGPAGWQGNNLCTPLILLCSH